MVPATRKRLRCCALLLIGVMTTGASLEAFAQEPTCKQLHAMAEMARAKSVRELRIYSRGAGESYRARTVFAARELLLATSQKLAGMRLLDLMPKDTEQNEEWASLSEMLCDGEKASDLLVLSKLGESLPRLLARAVLMNPDALQRYVTYALISVSDPHNDHTLRMQIVCRERHSKFMIAVSHLDPQSRCRFTAQIFDPNTCRAIDMPEAE